VTIDWDDPAARAELIERVGVAEYERQLAEHWREATVVTINGYNIRTVKTRFGQLYAVAASNRAFKKLTEARAYAKSLPPPTD
jgi:hypothetical protein